MQAATAHAPTASLSEESSLRQCLTFTLGTEEYGVDIMLVREVKGWTEVTRLPSTPPYVRGVLNLRGVVIPIIDLRARFTGTLTEATAKHVIIILAVGSRTIGVLADAVSDILTPQADDIRPAPDSGETDGAHYIAGLIAVEERMVVLLDIATLLPPITVPSVTTTH